MFPVTIAVLIVTAGYFAMWTSSKSDTPKGVASFGRTMAIILFVIAGITLVGGLAYGPRMHSRMMGMHEKMMGGMNDEEKSMCPGMMEKGAMMEKGKMTGKGKMMENKEEMPEKTMGK